MKSLSIFAISAVLAFSVALGGPGAYAQQEIDPDHFDSPNTESMPQPKTVDSKVRAIRFHGTFSLPYGVLCKGKKLAPGKYSIALRSDGKVGQVTFNQKGQAIEIAGVIQTEVPKQRGEEIVVENSENGRTLSLVRISGFAFVFDPNHFAASSPNSMSTRTERLPLTVIATDDIANRGASPASHKP